MGLYAPLPLRPALWPAEAAIPGCKFKIIRDMIERQGAVATAKAMLDLGKVATIQYGLDILAKNDLLDCSIEQAAIDQKSSGDFSASEIAVAKSRLMIVKRKKPE